MSQHDERRPSEEAAEEHVRLDLVAKYPILRFFEYAHLPQHLQYPSRKVAQLAWDIAYHPTKSPAEIAAGLRHLLEAKDCFVRGLL